MLQASSDFLTWDITTLATEIREKRLSPVDVTKAILDEITKKDQSLNSYITVMRESALQEAKLAEEAIEKGSYLGPLHGVPISIKDNVYVKDVKNTAGSKIYKDYIPSEDAELVTKLKAAG